MYSHVKEFHGRTHRVYCKACRFEGKVFCAPGEKLSAHPCPACQAIGELRIRHFNVKAFLHPNAGGLPTGDRKD